MGSEWPEVSLDQVAKLRNGAGVKQEFFSESGVPLARVSDFTEDSIDIKDCKFVKYDHARKWENHFISKGDVIVATVGSWPPNWSSVVGKVIRAPKQAVGAIQNQNTCCVKPNIHQLNNRFLFYRLKLEDFVWHAANSAGGSANQARLPVKRLGRFTFHLPPLAEQKNIAHVLGSLDDRIELNQQMNETLESMAQALFKSWFVDFDPVIDNGLASGKEIPEELRGKAQARAALGDKRQPLLAEIRSLFPDRFIYSDELGWIPEGWKTKAIDEAIEINPRVKLKKEEIAKFVDMKALPTAGFSVAGIIEKPYAGGAKFNSGDVLLARITPCLENGKTAVVDFLEEGEVGFGSTEFIVLRGKEAMQTPFVACLARDPNFRRHCIQSMVGSSGRQRVQNACFSYFHLALPPKDDLLRAFNKTVEGIFEKYVQHREQSEVLVSLRDTLLPKLLSGELRIPDAVKIVEELAL